MLRHIPRPDLERHSAFVLEQCLVMLGVQVRTQLRHKHALAWVEWGGDVGWRGGGEEYTGRRVLGGVQSL